MKESQEKMMVHSEVKIDLLKRYLDKYLNILSLSKYFGDINIYDLFCGQGVYENGGKGSPVVILEIIQGILNKDNEIKNKFNCLFNDIEEQKIIKLKNEISNKILHKNEMGSLEFSKKDYRVLLPKIINEIDSLSTNKAFVFIDPYGYKDIKSSDLKELIKSKKSEVLLFLPTQFMFRFEGKGMPECLKEFIEELMPNDKWPKSETGIDFIENLITAFRNYLGSEYYVDSFIITRELNQFFCLFFFTSHIYGFDKMLESKWEIDTSEGRGWHYLKHNKGGNYQSHQNNNTLFGDYAFTDKFEKKLLEYIVEERTNGELYKFRLQQGYLATHANDILKKLQDENKLLALNKDGSVARKSAFYLDYKHYKDEPDKIKIRLKQAIKQQSLF